VAASKAPVGFFQPVPMGAKGTGWNTRYSRPKPMVSVCGCRLENRYLRASSTGVEGPFSSSGNTYRKRERERERG